MSDKATVSGQFNLVDETTNTNKLSYDLSSLFTTITGIAEHNKVVRQLVSTDGVVALDKGGVGAIRGMMISITNGTGSITLKHDSNTAGIVIDSAFILFGTIDTITIETAETQPLTVEYIFFQ